MQHNAEPKLFCSKFRLNIIGRDEIVCCHQCHQTKPQGLTRFLFVFSTRAPSDNLRCRIYVFERVKLFNEFRFYVAKKLQISLLKGQLKDLQPGKRDPLRFRKGYFLTFLQLLVLKRITCQFRMSKWFGWMFSEDDVQLAISEIKIPFTKIFGHLNFQLRYPNGLNSSRS